MNPQRLRLIGVALTATACLFGLWHAEQLAAEVRFFGKPASKPAAATPSSPALNNGQQQANAASTKSSNGAVASPTDKTIKMNYFTRTWSDVLHDIAKQSGRELIIDKVPPGRFSRNDWSRYSLTDALKIMNSELEPKGFRVMERGKYLDLVFLRDARSEYARPIVSATDDTIQPAGANSDAVDERAPRTNSKSTGSPTIAKKDAPRRNDNSKPAASNVRRPKAIDGIQQASFEEMDDENDDDSDEEMELPEAARRWVAVPVKRQSPKNVGRSLYQAFEHDAEMIDQGPNGLPGFVVWKDLPATIRESTKSRVQNAPQRVARFAVGVDAKAERLLIDGSPSEIASVKALIAKLDVVSNVADSRTRLVSTKRDARQVANTLTSAVRQLAQAAAESGDVAETPAKPKTKPKKNTKKLTDSKPGVATNPVAPDATKPDGEMDAADDKSKTPGFGGPLKADVSIEELGDVLIIRGNEQDVQVVEKLIAEIEKMLAGSVPDVHVVPLEHVDSESLAELLSTVYERLNRSRGRSAQDQTQQIIVIAMGKPNAVMVLAAEKDMPTVDKLIADLDKPVDATKEFEVFRLRYAVASQMLTAIENFFGGGSSTGGGGQLTAPGQGGTGTRSTASGLRGRVKAISDSRTNSVIVQARPRDLEEVRRLIDELDQVGSNSVSQIKLIPLKNAVSDDMATLLNLAIQSVISPPQQARAQQGGGANQGNVGGGGAGATGQVDQKLRDAKSAVLQLLDTNDGEAMLESGILADIRINSDPHTNSLIVTAPEESHALIQALVKRFDKPSSMVAEIKHFSLKNADASSIVTMLNTLFNNQQQGQGQRAGGNQQNQQLGLLLAGADDASSQLIPLKFSTDIRTNSIIAVGGAEALSVVEAIIVRLDASDARQRTMSVVRLKNSPAPDVATAITTFLQGQQSLIGQGNQDLISDVEQLERQIIVVAEPNSNSLFISATPRYLKDIQNMITRIDAAQQQVVIQALIVEVTLDNTDEFGVEMGFQDSILFDRSTIGTATGSLQNITQSSIFNTNSQTSSVTPGTGATTTTTTVTPSSLQTSTPVATGVPGFLFNNLPFGNNISAPNAGKVGSQGLSNFSLGRVNSDLGYGGLVLSAGSESVNVLLRALAAKRKIEVLSRPQIRTLDNQLGKISVGQVVPIISSFNINQTTGVASPLVTQSEAGIILEVTPRITPDDRIVMQVGAQRSKYDLKNGVTLATGNAGSTTTSPVLDITKVSTTISVTNEQTVVLGGMIQKTDDTITRRVPWLGDIPIIGSAFRYDYHQFRRVEVLVFLTPRIVKNDSVNEMIKQIEAERMHYTEADAEALHGPLFACPVPLTDSSLPPVYAPGEMWHTPGNSAPIPPPPSDATSPSSNNTPGTPRVPSAPPSDDDSSSGIQGANYQQSSRTPNAKSSSGTRSNSAVPVKNEKRSSLLDTFRRSSPKR